MKYKHPLTPTDFLRLFHDRAEERIGHLVMEKCAEAYDEPDYNDEGGGPYRAGWYAGAYAAGQAIADLFMETTETMEGWFDEFPDLGWAERLVEHDALDLEALGEDYADDHHSNDRHDLDHWY